MRHFCKATSNNDHDAPAGAFRWYTSSINNLNTKSCGPYPFEATSLKKNSVSNLFLWQTKFIHSGPILLN